MLILVSQSVQMPVGRPLIRTISGEYSSFHNTADLSSTPPILLLDAIPSRPTIKKERLNTSRSFVAATPASFYMKPRAGLEVFHTCTSPATSSTSSGGRVLLDENQAALHIGERPVVLARDSRSSKSKTSTFSPGSDESKRQAGLFAEIIARKDCLVEYIAFFFGVALVLVRDSFFPWVMKLAVDITYTVQRESSLVRYWYTRYSVLLCRVWQDVWSS